jgi:hypothetical protein
MIVKPLSTMSQDFGWLLEVGAIGIDRTLKIIQATHLDLIQVEALFRIWDYNLYEEKKFLPWFETGFSYWDSDEIKKMIKLQNNQKPWRDYVSDQEIEKGRKLTQEEIDYLAQDWIYISQWYPGQDVIQSNDLIFERDFDAKKKKGNKEMGKFYRKPLHAWRMDLETIKLIKNGINNERYDGFDYNKFNRIKATSLMLIDAIHVINRKRKSMPARYSDEIIQKYYILYKGKIKQIIDLSSSISESIRWRYLKYELEVKFLKTQIRRHGQDRLNLVTKIALLKKELKMYDTKIDELSYLTNPNSVDERIFKNLQFELKTSQDRLIIHDKNKGLLLSKLKSANMCLQKWGKLRSK